MDSPLHIITGAAGFIAHGLIKRLLGAGERVAGFDNFRRGTPRHIEGFRCERNFGFAQVDVADEAAFQTGLRDLCGVPPAGSIVWHMAANSDIPGGVADPAIDLRDTFLTTHATLRVMASVGLKRIAFASSSAIYGLQDKPLDEDCGRLLPISNYGAMKLAAEAAISAAAETALEQAWIFRFPNVVGSMGTHGVLYDFARKLRRDPSRLPVLGDGSQQKPYLLSGELVDAMLFVVQHAAHRRNVFNIGPEDQGVTVRFIAEEMVRHAAPQAQIRYGTEPRGWAGDVPRFAYSTAKLGALGWNPSSSSADAIRGAIPCAWQESA